VARSRARPGRKLSFRCEGGGPVYVDASTHIDARGAGPREIDQLKAEMAKRDQTFERRVAAAVNRGKRDRLIASNKGRR
jgi:hypothetical protein